MRSIKKHSIIILVFILISCKNRDEVSKKEQAVLNVFERTIGLENLKGFEFELVPNESKLDEFSISNVGNKVHINGNSTVALVRGTYDYLKNECNSIISWAGSKIEISKKITFCGKNNRNSISV